MPEANIPKGWKSDKIENCVEILDNKRVPLNKSERAKIQGDIPYYGATGQVDSINDFIFNEELILLGEDGAPFLDISKNVAYLIKGKSWVNNHAHVMKGAKGILENKFLLYFLNSFNYKNFVNGTTRLKLNQSRLKEIPISFPITTLQEKIIAEIEKEFSRLDESREELRDVMKKLSLYRKAILREALETREGWEEKEIGEVCEIVRGGSPRPIKEYLTEEADGVNWIKIRDATKSGKYIFTTNQKIKPSGLGKTRTVEKGDIILTNSMSFGRPYIMETKGAIHDGWLLLKQNKFIDKNYLYWILKSDNLFRQFSMTAKGSAVKNLNIDRVKLCKICYPKSLFIQQKIVSKIEAKFSIIDTTEKEVMKSLKKIQKLYKGILKSAFEGKLVKEVEAKS